MLLHNQGEHNSISTAAGYIEDIPIIITEARVKFGLMTLVGYQFHGSLIVGMKFEEDTLGFLLRQIEVVSPTFGGQDYTLCSVLFILSIRSGTLLRTASTTSRNWLGRANDLVVSAITWRVGMGMANGRTN